MKSVVMAHAKVILEDQLLIFQQKINLANTDSFNWELYKVELVLVETQHCLQYMSGLKTKKCCNLLRKVRYLQNFQILFKLL